MLHSFPAIYKRFQLFTDTLSPEKRIHSHYNNNSKCMIWSLGKSYQLYFKINLALNGVPAVK